MADLQKAISAFTAWVKELDPDVECTVPSKPRQGGYHVTLSRSGEEQVMKLTEKELLEFEKDEKLHQKLEARVMEAIDELPGPEAAAAGGDVADAEFDDDAEFEEDEFDDDDLEEGEEEDAFDEDEEDDFEEEGDDYGDPKEGAVDDGDDR